MSFGELSLLGFVLLLLFMGAGMPVGSVMAAVGVVGFALAHSPQAALTMLVTDLYDTFSSYDLTVIPLFVLMGQIAFHAGISQRLSRTAHHWLGILPGGLAMATVGASAAFGAVCGSGTATAATMAAVSLPEMKRYRYSMELACGTAAAGGTLAILIPPSVVFIVYAILTEQSIGKLFVAGVLPGILVTLMFCATIALVCRWRPGLAPAVTETTWGEKFSSLGGVSETLVLFAVVVGGIFFGVFTPTEGAAVGAAGSLVVAAVKRELSWAMLWQCVWETLRTTCMIMTIVAGAIMFGHFLAITRLPLDLANWLASLPLPGWCVVGLIILFYLIAGCFVDALALIILTIPIFYPVILKLNYDLIWFGVIIVLVTQMGMISPPVGINVYIVSGMQRDVPMETVFKGALPFLAALVLASVILVAWPGLALFLPSLVK